MSQNENLNEAKNKVIQTFDEFVKENKEFWRTPEEIANQTGNTVSTIYKVINSYDEFVENKYGKITTRKIYREKTPFLKKLKDSFQNRIE